MKKRFTTLLMCTFVVCSCLYLIGCANVPRIHTPVVTVTKQNLNQTDNSVDLYIGETTKDGNMHGFGIYISKYFDSLELLGVENLLSGDIYIGNFTNNTRSVYGMKLYPSFTLGSYLRKNGYGANYTIYVGNFKNGLPDGQCHIYDTKGTMVEAGIFDGSNYRFTSSEFSKAEYSSHIFQSIDMGNGESYTGETVNGVAHGFGIMANSETGEVMYGYFINNLPDGKVIVVSADNTAILKIYQQGAVIESKEVSVITFEEDLFDYINTLRKESGGRYMNRNRYNQLTNINTGIIISPVKSNQTQIVFGNYEYKQTSDLLRTMLRQGLYAEMTLNSAGQLKGLNGGVVSIIEHEDNIRSGFGSVYDKNGMLLYTGQFLDDKPTGVYPSKGDYSSYRFGQLELEEGMVYIGEYHENAPHGFGLRLEENGNIMMGTFYQGKPADGDLLYMEKDGLSYHVNYMMGEMVSSQRDLAVSQRRKENIAATLQFAAAAAGAASGMSNDKSTQNIGNLVDRIGGIAGSVTSALGAVDQVMLDFTGNAQNRHTPKIITVAMSESDTCYTCNGNERCPYCDNGKITCKECDGNVKEYIKQHNKMCPTCLGSGLMDCPICKGSGKCTDCEDKH